MPFPAWYWYRIRNSPVLPPYRKHLWWTNIVKGESKNNKLVGLILPNRILYYTNIAIITHSPILSIKKSKKTILTKQPPNRKCCDWAVIQTELSIPVAWKITVFSFPTYASTRQPPYCRRHRREYSLLRPRNLPQNSLSRNSGPE